MRVLRTEKHAEFPGPQKALWSSQFDVVSALLATVVFGLAIGLGTQALCLVASVPTPLERLSSNLDSKVAVTLLVGCMSLMYVRRQFAYGMRPIAEYRSWESATSHFGLVGSSTAPRFFVVHLSNVGAGPLLVRKAQYRVAFRDEAIGPYTTFGEAFDKLQEGGVQSGEDIVLINIGEATAIESRGQRPVLELSLTNRPGLLPTCIDVSIEFEGVLGDRYTKEMFYLPRRGIDSSRGRVAAGRRGAPRRSDG